MLVPKKSLCVFIHFSEYPYIPNYVELYVNELSIYFDEVIIATNQRALNPRIESLNANISIQFQRNEGYDFGMFYKVFQTINPLEYNQIACVNDSNVLFNSLQPIFEWGKNSKLDFWGLIDSHEKPWFSTYLDSYHIQSHFIVFQTKAIKVLPAFFNSINIQDIFDEKDIVKLRQVVINQWEIGLTQFMKNNDILNGCFIDSQLYSLIHYSGKPVNVGHKLYSELIQSGFPLLKKKIITSSKWTDIFRSETHWEKMIRQYGNKDWKLEILINELLQIKDEYNNQPINMLKKQLLKVYNALQKKDVA